MDKPNKVDIAVVNHQNLNWFTDTKSFSTLPIAHWLLDETSLTAKLKSQYTDFKVQVLSEKTATPCTHEQVLFNLKSQSSTFTIREVTLLGNGQAQVYARSIIPNHTQAHFLHALGDKPLGEVLFNHPHTKRDPMQFTKIPLENYPKNTQIWGRRSLFNLNSIELLVCEFFLF